MEFYSPIQKKKPSSGIARAIDGAAPAASAIPGTVDYNGRPADGLYNNRSNRFSERLTVNGLSDPGWGRGETFQSEARPAVVNALKNGMSTANPQDYAGMDEMRDYLRNYLADLPGNTQDNISSFDTQAQRGLSNLLAQNRNQNAGRGTLGSRQQMSAQGDITSRATSDYMNSLIKARADALDQSMKIGQGLSNLQDQDMSERKFQFGQGQSLSDVILQLMNADEGREARLSANAAAQDSANKSFWGQLVNGGMTAGGLALASDVRLKEEIREVSDEEVLRPFAKARAQKWRYKNESKYGSGDYIAPMAQALIAAGMGDCVTKGSDGFLIVDYGRAMGRMFSAIGALTAKVSELEKGAKSVR